MTALDILFEDNHILAVNKPHNISTQGADSLEEQARQFIKIRDKKSGNAFVFAVHRLDKAASGIVIFAKSQKALSRLSESLRQHLWKKQYLAVVEGKTAPIVGRYTDTILHGDHRAIISTHPDAKQAILEILSAQAYAHNTWLLSIVLYTGRYHQIRAQLSSRHWPIVGDGIYGSQINTFLHLHHEACSLPHPTQKTIISISAPCQFTRTIRAVTPKTEMS